MIDNSPSNMKVRALLSLTVNDGEYQTEQAKAAQAAARKLDVGLDIIYAENDALTQSEQLLKVIQGPVSARPNVILMEPVGTGLPQVAKAAVSAGIGWVVLNRDVDYIASLRSVGRQGQPIFVVTVDHVEIGRIHGRQMRALLPRGGHVLYIEGPSGNEAARQRLAGMMETKPANIQLRTIRGRWTQESAYESTASVLRLSTFRDNPLDAVVAQDDSMAMGSRKAFMQLAADRVNKLVFVGCDGLPQLGQAWVNATQLTATIVQPTNADIALQLAVESLRQHKPVSERVLVNPISFPGTEKLAAAAR